MVSQEQLAEAANDEGFQAHLARVSRDFDAYMTRESTWFRQHHPAAAGSLVAYFSVAGRSKV